MIEGVNADILMTSGNSLILLCIGMIGYGIWKIFRISSRSRSGEGGSIELTRLMAETAVLNIKKKEDAKTALLLFDNKTDTLNNEIP